MASVDNRKRSYSSLSDGDDESVSGPTPKKKRMNEEKVADSEIDSFPPTSISSNRIIKLNVGGIKYVTTQQTLCGYESMLRGKFSGRFSMEPLDDGSHFLDRDGELFKYILKFLRNGKLSIPETWSKNDLHDLLMEAQYFAITSMVNVLSLKFFDSNILTNNVLKQQVINKIGTVVAEVSADSDEGSRRISPTNEWKLRFDYDIEKTRDHKEVVSALERAIQGREFILILIALNTWIFGKIHIHEEEGYGDADVLLFECEIPKHLERTDESCTSATFTDRCTTWPGSVMGYLDFIMEHKENLILNCCPLALCSVNRSATAYDFHALYNDIWDDPGGVERIEVWHIPNLPVEK